VAPERSAGAADAWLLGRGPTGDFDFGALTQHPEWAALIPSIERAGGVPSIALPRLAFYIAAVLSWNRTVSNLISRGDEDRLVSRHLAESLEPAGWLAESRAQRWIDLGSGAGLPALPIAIIGVGDKWLLVESRRPKILFLRRITQQLGLSQVYVAHARLEDLLHREQAGEPDQDAVRAGGFPFDAFTSRATLTLSPTLEMAAQSVRPGGHSFLWKGSRRTEEKASSREWGEHWEEGRELILESGQTAVCNFIRRN
jgi:16S rRNA (guanine(527)-N(7))-methyltransferase RsmG